MTAAIGHQALVNVPDNPPSGLQTGHILHRLVETSTRPFSMSVSVNSPAADTTGFGSSSAPVFRTSRGDALNSWTGTFEAYYPQSAPAAGHLGEVAFATGTVNRVVSYNLAFVTETHDVTGIPTTGWRDFLPGLTNATGTYTCHVPTGAAPTMVGQAGTATFTLTTGNTIAAPIVITDFSVSAAIGDKQTITYSFQITGNITSAGASSLLPAGAFTEPELTVVDFYTVATTRGFTGTCHMTGLTINVAIGEPVTVSGSVQGTGTLAAT